MNRILAISAIAVGLFFALILFEQLQSDEPFSAASFALDLAEKALLVLAVAATAYLAIETREFQRQRSDLLADLAKAQAYGDRWRAAARVHIEGLGQAIQDQFNEWELTNGESEIAMFMLKGLSHKEIARLRGSGEATVRQQARAIYRKSNLSSRAGLTAFFLEDLLPPQEQGHAARPH